MDATRSIRPTSSISPVNTRQWVRRWSELAQCKYRHEVIPERAAFDDGEPTDGIDRLRRGECERVERSLAEDDGRLKGNQPVDDVGRQKRSREARATLDHEGPDSPLTKRTERCRDSIRRHELHPGGSQRCC